MSDNIDKDNIDKNVGVTAGIGCIIAIIIMFSPFVTMAALNVVFGMGLEMNFVMYFSILWLQGLVAGVKR